MILKCGTYTPIYNHVMDFSFYSKLDPSILTQGFEDVMFLSLELETLGKVCVHFMTSTCEV